MLSLCNGSPYGILFLRHHWFGWCDAAELAPRHYPTQCLDLPNPMSYQEVRVLYTCDICWLSVTTILIHSWLMTCKVISGKGDGLLAKWFQAFSQRNIWWSCYLLLLFVNYSLYFNAWYTSNHALIVYPWYSELHSSFLSTHSMSDTLHFFLHHVRFKPPILLMY